MSRNADISALLAGARAGDDACVSAFFAAVYGELRRIAAAKLRNERADHTLQPSALVNEACMRLLGPGRIGWENRAHFFSTASGVMRDILVDHARARRARKRHGRLEQVDLDSRVAGFAPMDGDLVIAVDAALRKLAGWSERQAKVVELRWFAGFDVEETARILGVSPKTVKRDWSVARAWLQAELGGGAA
jgi:RNA polymerase sigma factor (TIGR02999 family)